MDISGLLKIWEHGIQGPWCLCDLLEQSLQWLTAALPIHCTLISKLLTSLCTSYSVQYKILKLYPIALKMQALVYKMVLKRLADLLLCVTATICSRVGIVYFSNFLVLPWVIPSELTFFFFISSYLEDTFKMCIKFSIKFFSEKHQKH